MSQTERELGWNDEIQNDGPEFVLIPEGEYDFVVTHYERARHNGSDKLPPCNKAVLHIEIKVNENQIVSLEHNLFLHTKTEGLLCSFFKSINQRQHGEKMKMDWNKVSGSHGRCHISHRKWTGKTGKEMTGHQIDRFLEPEEKTAAAAAGYTPGKF